MNAVERTTVRILNSFAGMVIFLVSMAAFYMPYEIRIIPEVIRFLDPVRYVCAGLLTAAFFFLYASTLTVFRKNAALIAAAGFLGILIFSTVMNSNTDLEGALGTYGLAGLFLVMDIAVFFRVNPKKYILAAFFLLLAVNIANTYTVYAYWNVGMWEAYGLYRNTFYSLVGNYNGGIEYVLPMAICGSAYAMRYGRWLDLLNYPAMIMSLIMAFKCDSETQKVIFAGILIFMILGNISMISDAVAKVVRIIFQPAILMAIDAAVFVLVVVINRTNWVAKLGIDPDFHNRRHVWNMSMEWIRQKPLWGNGHESVAQEAEKITGYAHSHCTYLEVAYKTGFVGSVLMILMAVTAVIAIYRNRHSRISFILSAMLFLFGLAAVTETYPMVYVLFCLGLIYYIALNTNESGSIRDRTRKMRPKDEYPDDPRQRRHTRSIISG